MPKIQIVCDSCGKDFTVTHKGKEEIEFCGFCGESIDKDWNSTEEAEELYEEEE
jgi:rRNA maturation endonuclease Nob1